MTKPTPEEEAFLAAITASGEFTLEAAASKYKDFKRMSKEREAFEAWAAQEYREVPQKLTHDPTDYNDPFFRNLWYGWQARAKQTITLTVKDATGEN